MLQVSPGSIIYIAKDPINFKWGIDKLVGFCRYVLEAEPMSGVYFIFRNKKENQIRILLYDGDGYWLCTKRFSKGRIKTWPMFDNKLSKLDPRDLGVLLWRGDLSSTLFPKYWHKIT